MSLSVGQKHHNSGETNNGFMSKLRRKSLNSFSTKKEEKRVVSRYASENNILEENPQNKKQKSLSYASHSASNVDLLSSVSGGGGGGGDDDIKVRRNNSIKEIKQNMQEELQLKTNEIKNKHCTQTFDFCFTNDEALQWLTKYFKANRMTGSIANDTLENMIELKMVIFLPRSKGRFLRFSNDDKLIDTLALMKNEIIVRDVKVKLQTVKNCFMGEEGLRWFSRYDSTMNPIQCLAQLTRSLELGLIVRAGGGEDGTTTFKEDNTLYKFFEPSVGTDKNGKLSRGTPVEFESITMARAISVRTTWQAAIKPQDDNEQFPMKNVTKMFFEYLYEFCPECKLMIEDDILKQSRILGEKLEVLINTSGMLDKTYLKNLGKHHKDIGITRDMYVAFGKAMLEMFSARIQTSFTVKKREAWVQWYICLLRHIFKGSGDDIKQTTSELESLI